MKLGPILIGIGLLFGYMFSGGIIQSLTNSKPVELTFEEFYNKGTSAEWLTLRDAYVDDSNKVLTEVTKNGQHAGYGHTYMPVRASPDDKRPIKVFVSYRKEGADKNDLPGDYKEIEDPSAGRTYALQTIRGVNLVGPNLPSELPGILQKGTLPAADKFLILDRDNTPPNGGEVAAMILFPIAMLALGIFLWRRAEQKSAATPAAPPKT